MNYRMKPCIFGAALLLATAACQKTPQVVVEGTIADADGATLYIEQMGSPKYTTLDSVVLDGQGSFRFSVDAPEQPEFYRLRLGEENVFLAIASAQPVTVSGNAGNLSTGYTVSGSDESIKMKTVAEAGSRLRSAFRPILQRNATDADRDKARTALQEYKKEMTRIILEDPASPVAYYIVFQQLDGSLIFDPYDKNDYKILAAVATSYDLNFPDAPRTKQLKGIVLQALASDRAAQQAEENAKAILELGAESTSLIDIDLYDMKGISRKLSDFAQKGDVVLLDFTVYLTKYSPDYNMLLADLYRKYHNKGFEIYQVSLDTDEHAWKVAADNLPWVCVRDPQSVRSRFAALYNVTDIPTCFLINRKGELIKRIEKIADIEKEVKALL